MSTARIFACGIAAFASLAHDCAPAQVILRQWNGTPQAPITDGFGLTLDGLGDVDGDTIPDVAIGAGSTEVQGMAYAGRFCVYSGRDGTLLYSIAGSQSNQCLGAWLSGVGDLDGDGAGDFLSWWRDADIGWTRMTPYLALFSGRTGLPLRPFPSHWLAESDPMRTFRDYYRGVGPGDVNGDGVPDFFLGNADVAARTGKADLVSGRDGSILRTFLGHYPGEGFGGVIAGGDIDGDGTPDLIVPAGGDWPRFGAGGVYAYSGKTGAQLFFLPPPPASNTFPSAVAGGGDVDGDGFDDVLVTDRGDRISPAYNELIVYGGPAGRKIFSVRWNLPFNSSLGTSVCGPGDVDGDGFADVLVLGGSDGYLISGRNRSVLFEWHGSGGTGPNGPSAPLGDIDGDDSPDLLMGGFIDPVTLVRNVRVYSGAPRGVTTLGVGCPDARGIVPRIGASHLPEPGKPFGINLSRTLPGKTAALVIGLSSTSWGGAALPLDLGLIGMPGCLLRASVDVLVSTATIGPKDQGRGSFDFTFPSDPVLRGARFYAQWLVLDPAGGAGSTTRGLDVTVQP